ncbi:hypothetical protein [Thalassoglobus polymorphus]|uniref:Uncharacterized protein n=1 Tax=Thalassoglobus polymorphus TaxID=2527994 RepID=A0A517QTQ3_9PLAN|nr:hypothetical protein [Thalassoglobus polymorphus]QDT34917.1 hypothetical protein Mal48_41900 [Thalassoglobus polymorphus]
MRRWGTNFIIVLYLGSLCYGLSVHALKVNVYDHLANYFVVWDMYCGWGCFEKRVLLIAEGESGNLYDVSPPWKPIRPYGSAERHDYDSWGFYSGRVAANTLRHTEHEPITRVLLVEQLWSKKYNIPDSMWARQFDEPKDPRVYYYVRTKFDPEGAVVDRHYNWQSNLVYQSLVDNPVLRTTIAQSRPFIVDDRPYQPSRNYIQQASFERTDSVDR